jgi:hypothetical protein
LQYTTFFPSAHFFPAESAKVTMSALRILLAITIFGSTYSFPAMAPLAPMNIQAMTQLSNLQMQNQSQGNAASTGTGAADFGLLQSLQLSNTKTGENGTETMAGSQGACAGGNCGLSGAAQLTAQKNNQLQKQSSGQNLLDQSGSLLQGGIPMNANLLASSALQHQLQLQNQNQISGASVGNANAALGNVSSVQLTVGKTDDKGASVGSSSLGQGLGQQVLLSGAVQAKGADQTAKQSLTQGEQSNNQSVAALLPSGVHEGTQSAASKVTEAKQLQSSSQGEGASVGQGSALQGAVQSGQTSNVDTNSHGTNVASSSSGQAVGKGLHLNGATSSQAQNAAQSQASSDHSAQQAVHRS